MQISHARRLLNSLSFTASVNLKETLISLNLSKSIYIHSIHTLSQLSNELASPTSVAYIDRLYSIRLIDFINILSSSIFLNFSPENTCALILCYIIPY